MKILETVMTLLKKEGMRDTAPRRAVLEALEALRRPASVAEIESWLQKKNKAVNTVTIYRIIETLGSLRLVHRHPANGLYSLCTIPECGGHHIVLQCSECDTVQELHDEELCKRENTIAKNAGFQPKEHLSAIIGICSTCQ